MIIIVINVKSFMERHLHSEARQVLSDLFSINQENGLKMAFVAGTPKISFKNLKT